MKYKAILLSAAAIVPVAVSGQAIAQEAQADAVSADTTGNAGRAQIEEIVVTAQKRVETAQSAPVAITAVSGEMLDERGIVDIRQLSTVVPSARFNLENNVATIYIRGVGIGFSNPAVPEAVGLQVNGVYTPLFATGGQLFDVARVEVLPGPQGTLYGRSSIGGITNITTRQPILGESNMDALLEVGNYDSVHFSGAVNLPVAEQAAVRIAMDTERRDGFNSNGTDNKNAIAGRVSFLAEPSDNLSLYLWSGYSQNKSRPSPLLYLPGSLGDVRKVPNFDESTAWLYPPNGVDTRDVFSNNRIFQIGGQFDLTLGDVQLSYIPGYIWHKASEQRVLVGFATPVEISGKQISNELRFSNASSGKLNWLLGLYQLHYRSPFFFTFGLNTRGEGALLSGADYTTQTDQYAVFGEAKYSLTPDLRVTVGGRYSTSRVKTDDAQLFGAPGFPDNTAVYDFNETWKRVDWKAGVEADVGPDSLVYANVQTGFNPGSFQYTFPNQGLPSRPQKMLGFTAGSKNRFFNDSIQANLEAFYYRYKDQIIFAFDDDTGSNQAFNAPKSRMYGAELSVIWAASDNTRFNVTGAYTNAKLTEFVTDTQDYSGLSMQYTPKWTVQAGFEQTVPLASGASFKFRVDSAYNDGYWGTFDHVPGTFQKSYTKTDLNLTYYFPGERYQIGLWVRNIENEDVASQLATTGRPAPFDTIVYLEAPRTYGVRAAVNF